MEDLVRCVLLHNTKTSNQIWSEKLSDALSRPSAEHDGKIVTVVQFHHNENWSEKLGKAGYPVKRFTGISSVYGTDVHGLIDVLSFDKEPAINDEKTCEDSSNVWLVGSDQVKISKKPKDSKKPMVKFVGLIERNPNMTEEEFHQYWGKDHSNLFCKSLPVKEKVVHYTQFHVSSEWTKEFQKAGFKTAPYEGIVELYFEHINELEALLTGEEHIQVIVPDESKFVNLVGSGILNGTEVVEWTNVRRLYPVQPKPSGLAHSPSA